MSERMYLAGGGHRDVPAVKIVDPKHGLGWCRKLTEDSVYDLLDIAAGLSELVDNRPDLKEHEFKAILEDNQLTFAITARVHSLSSNHIRPYQLYLCYTFARLAKKYAQLKGVEFSQIDEMVADEMKQQEFEILKLKSALDTSAMISKFAEAMVNVSRGELILRKWHDAMKGNSHAATFFLTQKSSKDVQVTGNVGVNVIDPGQMGHDEIMREVAALRKQMGKPVLDAEFEVRDSDAGEGGS